MPNVTCPHQLRHFLQIGFPLSKTYALLRFANSNLPSWGLEEEGWALVLACRQWRRNTKTSSIERAMLYLVIYIFRRNGQEIQSVVESIFKSGPLDGLLSVLGMGVISKSTSQDSNQEVDMTSGSSREKFSNTSFWIFGHLCRARLEVWYYLLSS
jgi:hypothetical protein